MDSLEGEGPDSLLEGLAFTPDRFEPFDGTDRYVLRRRLGEGGFGIVYEVDDQLSGTRLALKLLKSSSATFAENIERLKLEFRALADVVHPNLVGLHELVSTGKHWFITMDLVEGVDFSDYVAGPEHHIAGPGAKVDTPTVTMSESISALQEERLRDAMRQLAAAVSAIHAAGKLHRDLKPSNVMVDRRGRLVVLDFGLAGNIQPAALATAQLNTGGTPAYMAPEQGGGVKTTPASDWYAVGVMLYEALTGRLPFEGPALRVIAAKRTSDPVAPSAHVVGLPEDLEQLCLDLLARNPDERPSPSEILARLGASAETVSLRASEPQLPEIIGRGAELGALEHALTAAAEGRTEAVFVHASPGMGKTALCEQFLYAKKRDGAVVLAGRCYERESVPFKALDGVVDALCRYLRRLPRAQAAGLMPRDIHALAQLFPVLDGVPAIKNVPTRSVAIRDRFEIRRRAFTSLKELLGRIADKNPLIVFIDDLQWGDLDSSSLLAELLGPPDPPSLLLIGSYRSEELERSEPLAALLSGLAHQSIALSPLESADAQRLVSGALETVDDEQAQSIADEAGGHPLYLLELAREQRRRGRNRRSGVSLGELLRQRIDELHNEAQRLLELISIAGGPLEQSVCFEAAGVGAEATGALRLLCANQFVTATATGPVAQLRTYHDRVRETVVAGLDATRANQCHLSLAMAMEHQSKPDAESIAHHFSKAGETRRAGRYAMIAADAAANALAFERAARLYGMALDALPEDGPDRTETYEKLGQALQNSGRGGAAADAYLAAARLVSDEKAFELRCSAMEQYLAYGHRDAGMAVLEPLLDELGLSYPRSKWKRNASLAYHGMKLRFGSLAFRERREADIPRQQLLKVDVLEAAGRALEFSDMNLAVYFYARWAVAALRLGEPHRAARALASAIFILSVQGWNAGVDRAVALCAELVERFDDPRLRGDFHRMRGCALSFGCGRWREGIEEFERAESIYRERCTHLVRELRFTRHFAYFARFKMAQFGELERMAETDHRDALERGDPLTQSFMAIHGLAVQRLAAGDPDGTERILRGVPRPDCGSVIVYFACTLGLLSIYRDEPEVGRKHWDEVYGPIEADGVYDVPVCAFEGMRAYACTIIASAQNDSDLREAEKVINKLKSRQFTSALADVDSVHAMIAVARGQTKRADTLLARVADLYDEAEMPAHVAVCRRRLGELRDDEALIREADTALSDLGIADPARWTQVYMPRSIRM